MTLIDATKGRVVRTTPSTVLPVVERNANECAFCGGSLGVGTHMSPQPDGSVTCVTNAPLPPPPSFPLRRRPASKSGVEALREKWEREHPEVWRR